MNNKWMNIPNDDKLNYSFCKLRLVDNTSLEPTNQNLMKVLKVFEPTNKKIYL